MTPPAAGAFSATWITRIGGLVFALILARRVPGAIVLFHGADRPGITP